MPNPEIYTNELQRFTGKYNLEEYDLSKLMDVEDKIRRIDDILTEYPTGRTPAERFIYFAENKDTCKVREIMQAFKSSGKWIFENFNADAFSSVRCDDSSIKKNIRSVYEKYGKIIDPHTACGFENPEHFSKVFKKLIGLTPSEYMKKNEP